MMGTYSETCGRLPTGTDTHTYITDWWKCAYRHAESKGICITDDWSVWSITLVLNDIQTIEGASPYRLQQASGRDGDYVNIWMGYAPEVYLGRFKWKCPPETKSNFAGTISTPSSLSPQGAGATLTILNSLTIQNTGNKSGSCNINIYEATSAGANIKMLNNTTVILNSDETYDWINKAAVNGLSKTYAAGDTLYLCFKTWGIDESEPSCGGGVVSIPVQSETETKEYFIKP